MKLEERERVMEEAEATKREHKRRAADRRKKLDEVMKEKWSSSHSGNVSEKESRATNADGKSLKRRRKSAGRVDEDDEDDYGGKDSRFDTMGEDSADEGKNPTSQANGDDDDDIFGDDSDVEEEGGESRSGKRTSNATGEEEPLSKRQRGTASDDEEEVDFQDTAAAAPLENQSSQ
jgi:hypothetical protein